MPHQTGPFGSALLDELLDGRVHVAETDERFTPATRRVWLGSNVAGQVRDLLDGLELGRAPVVVADRNTAAVLGQAVASALDRPLIVLDAPHADDISAAQLAARSGAADGLIAVGSGTLNDLCKYVGAGRGLPSACVATAPSMNGFVTPTASLAINGLKSSLPAQAPVAVLGDVDVLAAAPIRLRRAGIGDSLCRGTVQVDWLLSHRLLDSAYWPTPFAWQRDDEAAVTAQAPDIVAGEVAAVAALTRLLLVAGFGMALTGTSQPGSQGEHAVAHYLETFLPGGGALHGEQIAVTTLSLTAIQEALLAGATPVLTPHPTASADPADALAPPALLARVAPHDVACRAALRSKAARIGAFAGFNAKLAAAWPALRAELRPLLPRHAGLQALFTACGVPTTPGEIGVGHAAYSRALGDAYALRDRFGALDLLALRQAKPVAQEEGILK